MPGGGQPIVIGGGIQLAGGAIDEFLVLTSIDPPVATTSPRIRRSGNDIIIGFTANPNSTAIGPTVTSAMTAGAVNALAIVIGSAVSVSGASSSGNVILASNLTALGQNNVIWGPQTAAQWAGVPSTFGNSIVIGASFNPNNAGQGGMVAVGANIAVTGASSAVLLGSGINYTGFGNGGVCIGSGITSPEANVIIGKAAGATGANTVIVGHGSVSTGTTSELLALGSGISIANLDRIIAIGHAITASGFVAGDIVIGHNNIGGSGFSSRVVWGGADLHTNNVAVPAWTFRHKNAQGNDVAAGNVTYIAPLATGNAVGGSFVFQTGPAGGAGAALQAATTRLTISPNGVATFAAPTAAAENIIVTGFGGAGQASVRLNGLTNGAGAAAGTLLNAPAAGDPAFWIPVNIAGTVRFVPAW